MALEWNAQSMGTSQVAIGHSALLNSNAPAALMLRQLCAQPLKEWARTSWLLWRRLQEEFLGQDTRQRREKQQRNNHSMGTTNNTVAIGCQELQALGQLCSSQNEGALCLANQQHIVVYTASYAVNSRGHIEKKGHAECPRLYTIETKQSIYNRWPSRSGEKQNSQWLQVGSLQHKRSTPHLFPTLQKLTHMHTAQHHCPQVY